MINKDNNHFYVMANNKYITLYIYDYVLVFL